MNSVPPSPLPIDHRRKLPNELLAEIFRSIHPKPVYASIQEWNNGVVNLLPLSSKMAYEFAGPIFHKKRKQLENVARMTDNYLDAELSRHDYNIMLIERDMQATLKMGMEPGVGIGMGIQMMIERSKQKWKIMKEERDKYIENKPNEWAKWFQIFQNN